MKDWEVYSIKDIGKIVTGSTPSTKNELNYSSNDYSFVKPSDISQSQISYIDETECYVSEYAFKNSRILPSGAVLVTCIGIIGKVGIIVNDCICNQQINAIIPNEKVNNKFLAYSIFSKKEMLALIANAPVVPIINKNDFSNIKLSVPPLQTQQQIVEELDCLTSIIEKQKKQLEELDNLAQSIFYDMFGDPIENEKGWNILNLNQIGNFKNGLNFRKHEKGHSIKVLGVGDFKDNKEIRDFKHIETVEISDEISDDYLLKDEDIVFIRSNGSKDLVGRCIIVFPNKQEITFSGFCIRFRRTDDNYISLFLLYLFKNESFKRYYINRSNGCNINNISQTTLSIIPIPSPPLSLQQQFASKIEAIEKQKELIKKSIKETEDLFNSRMDYYFN